MAAASRARTPRTQLGAAGEEIGITPSAITIRGRFDDAWSSAGFRVTPVVGTAPDSVKLRPSLDEVTETRVVALRDLADPAHRRRVAKEVNGHEYVDEIIDAGGWEVYGLTADLVLDLTTWLDGGDRRRLSDRRADLEHFAPRHW